MKIKFVSRWDAKRMIKDGYFVNNDADLISISDNNREKAEMKALWINNKKDSNAAHFLNFKDIDDSASCFAQAKASGCLRFIKETSCKKKELVVHCFLGISRSGAIAKFAHDYFSASEDEYLRYYKGYNVYVYCQMV